MNEVLAARHMDVIDRAMEHGQPSCQIYSQKHTFAIIYRVCLQISHFCGLANLQKRFIGNIAHSMISGCTQKMADLACGGVYLSIGFSFSLFPMRYNDLCVGLRTPRH